MLFFEIFYSPVQSAVIELTPPHSALITSLSYIDIIAYFPISDASQYTDILTLGQFLRDIY